LLASKQLVAPVVKIAHPSGHFRIGVSGAMAAPALVTGRARAAIIA
jgi:hypothetical protein